MKYYGVPLLLILTGNPCWAESARDGVKRDKFRQSMDRAVLEKVARTNLGPTKRRGLFRRAHQPRSQRDRPATPSSATPASIAPSADGFVRFEANAEGFFLRSRDEGTDLELDGRLFVDLTSFEGAFNGAANGRGDDQDELRSAMIRLHGSLRKNLKIFIQYGAEQPGRLIIGSMTYRHAKPRVDTTLGLLKEPFGFEFQSGRRHLATMERPLVQTLTPGISVGLRVRGQKEHFSWAGGVFRKPDSVDRLGFTGRFIYIPVRTDNRLLHFGIAASHRFQDGTLRRTTGGPIRAFRIGQSVVEGPGPSVDASTHLGLEAVGKRGPFTWQVEAVAQKVSGRQNEDDATYAGFYAQSTFFLRGAKRIYQVGSGRFNATDPELKHHALELVGRYEQIDLDNGHHLGTRVDSLLLGLNWHWSKNLKLMFQATRARVSGRGAVQALKGAPRTGNAVAMRLQIMI